MIPKQVSFMWKALQKSNIGETQIRIDGKIKNTSESNKIKTRRLKLKFNIYHKDNTNIKLFASFV